MSDKKDKLSIGFLLTDDLNGKRPKSPSQPRDAQPRVRTPGPSHQRRTTGGSQHSQIPSPSSRSPSSASGPHLPLDEGTVFPCDSCNRTYPEKGMSICINFTCIFLLLYHHSFHWLLSEYFSNSFTTIGKLKRHILAVHQKVKTCPEPGCNKGFSSRADLNQHCVEMHKKELAFACQLCEKKFRRAGNLARHVQASHKIM